jgi:hypothetical protein
VAATGDATQLFPNTIATTVSTATYPPVGGGLVRRPTDGTLLKLHITPDGTNGGLVEVWDVAGLDRGATNNVNDATALTNAYLVANGRKLAEMRITGTSTDDYDVSLNLQNFNFIKGLAVRFVNAGPTGKVTVTPFVAAGFLVQYIAG